MPSPNATPTYAYERLVADIIEQIRVGNLRPGDRVPSVRRMSAQRGVSIPTVLQAYGVLEARRIIASRPQSGYYVLAAREIHDVVRPPTAKLPHATEISTGDLIMRCLEMVADASLIPLGTALPDPDLLPGAALARFLGRAARRGSRATDLQPAGAYELRHEIARRASQHSRAIAAEDVVVTCGCAEAITLCLRALTSAGDTVAVESPAYFGTLQAIEGLGLKALEIPTDPQEGLSLEVLRSALERGGIAALIVSPNVHNPLGAVMSNERKRSLIDVVTEFDIPVIEDDTYGELSFGNERAPSLQSFDRSGLVLTCGSFSKTLAPGYRIGWTVPGRHRDRVIHYKLSSTVATSVPTQLALATYLAHGGYDGYLRRLRRIFQSNLQRMTFEIAARFPAGTRISQPAGGFLLWVQLPEGFDSVELQRRAMASGLSVAPGPAFSASGDFRSCLRINAGYQWSARTEEALNLLARLIADGPSAVADKSSGT